MVAKKFRGGGNKYNAVKTKVDGIVFDSKKEALRYRQLSLLQTAEKISELKLQVTFKFACGVKYVADFTYVEDGKKIAEDVKGYRTDVYRLKAKMFKHEYPDFELRET